MTLIFSTSTVYWRPTSSTIKELNTYISQLLHLPLPGESRQTGLAGKELLHGALLDAQILADVYLAMTGGQTSLLLSEASNHSMPRDSYSTLLQKDRPVIRVIQPDESECELHRQRLAMIDRESGGNCIWIRMDQDPTRYRQ